MANRFPLIVDSSALQIKELPANDNIDLTNSGIVNATSIGIATLSTTNQFQVGSGSTIVIVDNLGDLGIGTTSATSKLHVVGDVLVSGVVTASSFRGSSQIGVATGGVYIGLSTQINFVGSGINLTHAYNSTAGIATITFTSASSGGGGSGQFNTGISSQVGYDITSSMAAAKTLPSTSGKTYVIQSIQVTNVSTAGTDARVTGRFAFNGAETVEFAHRIPVPYRASVELLKQPQVLNPSDAIQFQGFFDNETAGSNLLNTFIVYEEQDSTDYKGVGAGLSVTTPVGVFTSTTYPSVIQSVRLTNISDLGDYAATVSWTTGAGTTQAYIARDFIVPKNSSVELLDAPKRVDAGHIIRAQVGVSTTIHIQVSAKNIV